MYHNELDRVLRNYVKIFNSTLPDAPNYIDAEIAMAEVGMVFKSTGNTPRNRFDGIHVHEVIQIHIDNQHKYNLIIKSTMIDGYVFTFKFETI